MRILVACEYSGTVRDALLRLGHDAISCDLLPTESPGPHYQGDIFDILYGGWDMLIAHPPCTYLASSGLHWNSRVPGREALTEDAIQFAAKLMGSPIPKKAMENPVGCLSTRYRKPDQIIHPYQFGDDASKATCLWLEGLAPLVGTSYIKPRIICCGETVYGYKHYGCPECGSQRSGIERWGNQDNAGQCKLPPSADRGKVRAATYKGIAEAMALQWAGINK